MGRGLSRQAALDRSLARQLGYSRTSVGIAAGETPCKSPQDYPVHHHQAWLTAKKVAGLRIEEQRLLRKTRFTGISGKFDCHIELLAFLDQELILEQRSPIDVSTDAGISRRTLSYLIKKGKIPLPLDQRSQH